MALPISDQSQEVVVPALAVDKVMELAQAMAFHKIIELVEAMEVHHTTTMIQAMELVEAMEVHHTTMTIQSTEVHKATEVLLADLDLLQSFLPNHSKANLKCKKRQAPHAVARPSSNKCKCNNLILFHQCMVSLRKQCRCKCKTKHLWAVEEPAARHNRKLHVQTVSIPKTRCRCNQAVAAATKASVNLKIRVVVAAATKVSANLKILTELLI